MIGQTIRKILKRGFDRISNEKFKNNLLQAIPFWVASLVSGLIAVFYSKIFGYLEGITFKIIHFHYWMIFVFSPACFVIAWWLVNRFAKYAGGSGIPQAMAAIELANPRDDKKVTKLLSLKVFL